MNRTLLNSAVHVVGSEIMPNKEGENPKRKHALNRGYALIKQMRLTTSRYGIGPQFTLTNDCYTKHM